MGLEETENSSAPADEQAVIEAEARAKWESLRPSFNE